MSCLHTLQSSQIPPESCLVSWGGPGPWVSAYFLCITILENSFHKPHIVVFELEISVQLPFEVLQPSQSQLLIVWEVRTYFKKKRYLKVAMLVLTNSFF